MGNLEGKANQPTLRSIVTTGRAFYERCGALPLYDHCHRVSSKSASVGIIETKMLANPNSDRERRAASYILANTAMYHVLKPGYLDVPGVRFPEALHDERIAREIHAYAQLTENERTGASLAKYVPILNTGAAPLALLIKLADYSVTHRTEEMLEGLINPKASKLFRLYRSESQAIEMMAMDALAGEKIYGPVAELFGFPLLAGDIFEHAFKVNHPEIYDSVMMLSQDSEFLQRLGSTQKVVKDFARLLRNILQSHGFDAEVIMRKEKHAGKQMNKMIRLLREDFDKLSGHQRSAYHDFNDYVKLMVPPFNYGRFNDWVALRVIVKSYRGRDLDQLLHDSERPVPMEAAQREFELGQMGQLLRMVQVNPLKLAVKIVGDALESLALMTDDFSRNECRIKYNEKPNGYRAFHFDSHFGPGDQMPPLPFEVQLKTANWHDVAEGGMAAHYYYLGGDTEIVDMVRNSYQEIIHRYVPKARPQRSG